MNPRAALVLLCLLLRPFPALADNVPAGLRLAVEVWAPEGETTVGEIWLLEGNGASRVDCPENAQGVGDPALHPGGLRIAYAFGPEGKTGIGIVDLDGRNGQVLLAPEGSDAAGVETCFERPRFNAVGDKLAVTERITTWTQEGNRKKASVRKGIRIVEVKKDAKSTPVPVDRPVDLEPLGWGPDGRVLVRGEEPGDGDPGARATSRIEGPPGPRYSFRIVSFSSTVSNSFPSHPKPPRIASLATQSRSRVED